MALSVLIGAVAATAAPPVDRPGRGHGRRDTEVKRDWRDWGTVAPVEGTYTLFDPVRFERSTGQPKVVTFDFEVANPEGEFTIHLVNGDSDSSSHRVSSAIVRLNDVEVFGTSAFNQQVGELSSSISLQQQNVLSVEVRSQPGSYLVIWIVGIDTDPPTITAAVTPDANAADWHNTQATVTFTCDDATSGIAECTDPVTVDVDGAGQIITGTAVDRAGLTAETSVTINMDTTPPVVDATIAPPPNAAGWNNTPVEVVVTCSDDTSGVAQCPSSVQVDSEGMDQLVEGTASDVADNEANFSVVVHVDLTPPTLTIDDQEVVGDETLFHGTVTDALSGLEDLTCGDVSLVVETDGTFTCALPIGESADVVATDFAGNATTQTLNELSGLKPALELLYIDEFERVFKQSPLGVNRDRRGPNLWRPVVPEPEQGKAPWRILGYYFENKPVVSSTYPWGVVETAPDKKWVPSGFAFAVRDLNPDAAVPALMDPVPYGTGCGGAGCKYVPTYYETPGIGIPNCPDDYVWLGMTGWVGGQHTIAEDVACVHKDLVVEGAMGNQIYRDIDTDDRLLIQQIVPREGTPGLYTGTFMGYCQDCSGRPKQASVCVPIDPDNPPANYTGPTRLRDCYDGTARSGCGENETCHGRDDLCDESPGLRCNPVYVLNMDRVKPVLQNGTSHLPDQAEVEQMIEDFGPQIRFFQNPYDWDPDIVYDRPNRTPSERYFPDDVDLFLNDTTTFLDPDSDQFPDEISRSTAWLSRGYVVNENSESNVHIYGRQIKEISLDSFSTVLEEAQTAPAPDLPSICDTDRCPERIWLEFDLGQHWLADGDDRREIEVGVVDHFDQVHLAEDYRPVRLHPHPSAFNPFCPTCPIRIPEYLGGDTAGQVEPPTWGDLSRAKAYVRVRQWNHVFTELQFWLFYSYNGRGKADKEASDNDEFGAYVDCGPHFGDWEQVTLRVVNDATTRDLENPNAVGKLASVYMSRHSFGEWVRSNQFATSGDVEPGTALGQESWSCDWFWKDINRQEARPNRDIAFQMRGDNCVLRIVESQNGDPCPDGRRCQHPIIYSSQDSHAHYPTPGWQLYNRVGAGDFEADIMDRTSDGGKEMYTSAAYKLVSSEIAGVEPTDSPAWLEFTGRWGQYGRCEEHDPDAFGARYEEVQKGPSGPNMKKEWKTGPSAELFWNTNDPGMKESCYDGIDNDGDGFIDWRDRQCWTAGSGDPNVEDQRDEGCSVQPTTADVKNPADTESVEVPVCLGDACQGALVGVPHWIAPAVSSFDCPVQTEFPVPGLGETVNLDGFSYSTCHWSASEELTLISEILLGKRPYFVAYADCFSRLDELPETAYLHRWETICLSGECINAGGFGGVDCYCYDWDWSPPESQAYDLIDIVGFSEP